ncbi:hypothetical protein BsWGS_08134 [Bradybaena similaris]
MATASTSFSTVTGPALDFKTLLESHAYISYLKAKRWSNCIISKFRNCKIRNFLLKGTDSEYESLRFEISWDNARLEFQDPKWTFPPKDVRDSSRNVYETWEYENSVSDFEVTNEHKNKTKAVFSLAWLEGNTFGLDLNTTVNLPTQAREVFGESAVLNINGPSFETYQDQEWKISVKVPVPENQTTKLVTVIHEKSFKGTFKSCAFLRGRVSVRIFNKKNNELLTTVTDDVSDFWNKMRREMSRITYDTKKANSIAARLEPFDALSGEHREMIWLVSGECRFTVGTHGSIKVEPAGTKCFV